MSTKKYKNCKKCKTRKRFLYHPDDPKKSFDVYIDKNPRDTIHINYKTVDDVKATIRKLERLYKDKKYTHKRIWQVGMIMKVRLEVLRNKLSPTKYNKFIIKMDKLSGEIFLNPATNKVVINKKRINKISKLYSITLNN